MEKYIIPEIEIVRFDNEDIITESITHDTNEVKPV